jgi:hypothetical protein
MIKSRRMRWVGPVSRMGERKGAYEVLINKRKEKESSERL